MPSCPCMCSARIVDHDHSADDSPAGQAHTRGRHRSLALAPVVTSDDGGTPGSSEGDAGSGQDDFDWEFGTWSTTVQVLADPLSDAAGPVAAVRRHQHRPRADGPRANVVELRVSGPGGQINGLNLRLYQPQARRWSSTFTNLRDGMPAPSVYGGFHHGVGEFYGDDHLAGRRSRCGSSSTGKGQTGQGSSRRSPMTAARTGRRTGSPSTSASTTASDSASRSPGAARLDRPRVVAEDEGLATAVLWRRTNRVAQD